jgi:hypothetical protein
MKILHLFIFAICLASNSSAQVCSERFFSRYEKIILLDVYMISSANGSFIKDKGVFFIREDTMPNSDILWEISMIYDDLDIKNNSPTVYGYVANVPVLFVNKRRSNDVKIWECLKPKLFDWLFITSSEKASAIKIDHEILLPNSENSFNYPKMKDRVKFLIIYNKWGEIKYKNFHSLDKILNP